MLALNICHISAIFHISTSDLLCNDLETLNDAEQVGKIVVSGRETYRQEQFGHGHTLLKLSQVQDKLGKYSEAKENKKEALRIINICLGEVNSLD